MSTITALALILLVLMVLVGGKQGWTAFLSLFLNFCFFYFGLVLVALHISIPVTTVIIGTIILATTVFIGVTDLKISISAFESSITVMVIVIFLVFIVEYFVQAIGFSTENSSELEGMSILIGISYLKISMMTTILSCLGAVAEASIAVVSGLYELISVNVESSRPALFKSSLMIGKRIIGTTLNTLLLGLLGNLLALFVWFTGLNYSLGTIINNKIFAAELVIVIISFIGVILVVPVSAQFVILNHRHDIDKSS